MRSTNLAKSSPGAASVQVDAAKVAKSLTAPGYAGEAAKRRGVRWSAVAAGEVTRKVLLSGEAPASTVSLRPDGTEDSGCNVWGMRRSSYLEYIRRRDEA